MAQIKNPLDEVRIPFAKMTFSPDVPSTALGPNEYNIGLNVETDVRGIRSVAGEQEFFNTLTGTPTYISSGFRADTNFWFIVATTEGKWWATYNGTWSDITPTGGDFTQYAQNTNITEAWNGTVPFFNDTFNPPMVWLDGDAKLTIYSEVLPTDINDITYFNPTQQRIIYNTFTAGTGTTIVPGDGTNGASVGQGLLTIGLGLGIVAELYVGQYVVATTASGTPTTEIAYGTKILANVSGVGAGSTWVVNISQTVTPASRTVCGPFAEIPYNPGDKIVISGVNGVFDGTFTVAQNSGSLLASTLTSVKYLAVPTAGYPGGGSVAPLYSWNYNPYWSNYSANFMRMYSTPNVGSILVAGNLTATNSTTAATEEYPVTIQWSQAFGLNQAPLTWEPTITNVANQLEVPLRGPALDAFPSNGQFFLCSYWDTVVFSPLNYSTTSAPILGVRLYNQGRGLLSSNCWANTDKQVYGVDARDIWVFDGQDFQGIGNQRVKNWFYDQLDPEFYDRVFMEANSQKNQIEIYYPDSQAVNGVPNKMISYRYDLDCWNAPRDVSSATMGCESPIYTELTPGVWTPNLGSRTIVYAQGVTNSKIVQKDIGYTKANGTAIASRFRRDNIKMIKDYSGKLMVHRILPEAVNIGAVPFSSSDEISIIPSLGNLSVTIEGAQSVGQLPTTQASQAMALNTDNPWIQMNQNSYRVNSIELSNTSSTDVWMCSATTWQFTQVEDDR